MSDTTPSISKGNSINQEPLHGIKLVLATIALGLGSFMNVLDISIANVSLPTIAGDFAVSPAQGTWVITSYAVSEAIMLPLTGWLSSRFGEIRQFIIATLLFTLFSVLCGLAWSFPVLLIGRVFQGIVGASMIPLSQALIVRSFPVEKRGMALGIWALTTIIAPVSGPLIGGWLTDHYSWRWVFYINIPFGLLCTGLVFWLMKGRDNVPVKKPIDAIGLLLLAIGIGCLQIMLDKGNELDWFSSSFISTVAVISIISLISFVIWELGEEHPVVDLSLFKIPNFLISCLCLFVGSFAFYIFVVIGPLWMQTQLGYTPVIAGMVMASTGLLAIVAGPLFGSQLPKLGARRVATFGYICFAISAIWSGSVTTDVDFHYLQATRWIMGFGIAGFFVPLTAISLSRLKGSQIAAGAGLTNFLRNLGGSIGTALGVTIWQNDAIRNHAVLSESIQPSNLQFVEVSNYLTGLGLEEASQLQLIDLLVTSQSYMLSTNHLLTMSGIIMLSLIPIIWFAKPPFAAGGGGH
jgi:MFS transporter, DHA2 family, multidrug resistance protein